MYNNNELTIFCNNVKLLRLTNRLSKRDMAKILGIGYNSLALIEKGIMPPRLGGMTLYRIQKNFGIAPKDMFTPL